MTENEELRDAHGRAAARVSQNLAAVFSDEELIKSLGGVIVVVGQAVGALEEKGVSHEDAVATVVGMAVTAAMDTKP